MKFDAWCDLVFFMVVDTAMKSLSLCNRWFQHYVLIVRLQCQRFMYSWRKSNEIEKSLPSLGHCLVETKEGAAKTQQREVQLIINVVSNNSFWNSFELTVILCCLSKEIIAFDTGHAVSSFDYSLSILDVLLCDLSTLCVYMSNLCGRCCRRAR